MEDISCGYFFKHMLSNRLFIYMDQIKDCWCFVAIHSLLGHPENTVKSEDISPNMILIIYLSAKQEIPFTGFSPQPSGLELSKSSPTRKASSD